MREVDGRVASRIKGRASLEKALRRLVIRAHRYGQHRASTDGDRACVGRVIDVLTAALDAPHGQGQDQEP
jgi:hypothetical protein